MFQSLFSSWRTFRQLASGSADEELAYQAYADFEEQCEAVAYQGQLDAAITQALGEMSVEDAGDLHSDLLNFASECSLDALANGEPALVNARVFGLHAIGVLGDIATLHGNQALVQAMRGSGFVEQDGIVMVAGAIKTGEAARLSPQSLWAFTQQAAGILGQVNNPEFDFSQVEALRQLLPVLDGGEEPSGEAEVGAAVILGVRVLVEQDIEGEDVPLDPLDAPNEAIVEQWHEQAAQALSNHEMCTVLTPMPWRDSVAQSIALAAEAHILMQQDFAVPTVDRMVVEGKNDGVELIGMDQAGTVLGSYHLPGDISFWAMPEIVDQLRGQGIEVQSGRAEAEGLDLASMPSPGKLLN